MKNIIILFSLVLIQMPAVAQILERSYFHGGYRETPTSLSVTGEPFNNVYEGDIVVYETMLLSDLSSIPLGVKLVEFTAGYRYPYAVLKWKIADEAMLDFYIIEKSVNGSIFYEVGKVKAIGDNQTYNFNYSQEEFLAFYRLKMTGDEATIYSNVEQVSRAETGGNEALKVYPNPVIQGYFFFDNLSSEHIFLCSMEGKVIKQVSVIKGSNIIDVADLSSGTYILKTDNNQFIKITIQ